MSLLTTPVIKSNDMLTRFYFIFLKQCPRPNLIGFQYQIWFSVKRSEVSYQVEQVLAFFCKLVALILV